MKDLPPLFGRVLSAFVVWTVVGAALMAMVTLTNTRAGTLCSQSNVIIGGDWTVSSPNNEVCIGTMYTMTGNLQINAGASLELRDGGIQFAQTLTQKYTITVLGTLLLNNSKITVTGDSIDPYLKLNFLVTGGRLEMIRGSSLAFPGWLTASGTARVIMTQSSVEALDPTNVTNWAANVEENNDAPVMSFADTNVQLYDSELRDLFENPATIDGRRSINLTGATNFLAVNSYLGIDFANETTGAPIHNTLSVADPALAFLLWPTFDLGDNTGPIYTWSNAINVTGNSAAYIYRRVDVTVVDVNNAPVDLATLRMTYTGTATDAEYPDRSVGATTPHDNVLAYLGRPVPPSWKVTNESGQAAIPLVSDRIDRTGVSFRGNYNITATSGGYVATKQLGLVHYPMVDDMSNQVAITIQMSDLTQPLPDLKPDSMTYVPQYPKMNQTVTITITVANEGLGSAKDIDVKVYDNIVQPGALIDEVKVPFMGSMSTTILAPFTWRPQSGGTHLIIVLMDPDGTIAESNEGNNQNSYPLPVTPLGPDLEAVVPTMTGFAGNPVDLEATINNVGDLVAQSVVVSFYIDSINSLVGTNSSVPDIPVNGSVQVSFAWVPPSVGTYTVIAWVDPANLIPEPPPYSDLNNQGSNILTVLAAPNPTTYSDEIGASDPYPTLGSTVTLSAVVRNIGQADITAPFFARFSMDGGPQIQEMQVNSLAVGDKQTVSTTSTWAASSCGFHTLHVDVDSRNTVAEGRFYESDNNVTRSLQVFQAGAITYAGTATLKYLPVAQNIVITGHLTIEDGSIIVTEPQEACGRVFIKILGSGILTLINSTIAARDSDNWPVVIYVGGSGRIEASKGSNILLNTAQGDGIIEVGGNGVIELTDTTVDADISAHGATAVFNRVTFEGKRLHANTQGMTRIWDPVFLDTNYLALRSDDVVPSTPDIDLRNATLDSTLTSQLVFGGHQYAHITNVTTTKMTRWWEGTITQKAKVTRFWWLTVKGVDGTGAVLRPEANTNFTLYRLNTVTLNFDLAPNPVPGDDIFGTTNNTWPVAAPNGLILYKAASEDRYASVQAQWMNATYKATGGALIGTQPYAPDQDISGFVNQSTTFTLVFSKLTPDLSVDSISFSGENGVSSDQPLNRPMHVSATIRNTGDIGVPNVWVNFYFVDVDVNGDNLMDLPNSSYAPEFIGGAQLFVPLNSTATTSVLWDEPQGSFELSYVVSVVVDPSIANPADGGLIKETNEFNNILARQLRLHTWPDLHLEVGQVDMPTAIEGNDVTIGVTVTNPGTNDGTGAWVELRVDGSQTVVSTSALFDIARGGSATTHVTWTAGAAGNHTLEFTVNITGGPWNKDYNMVDNTAVLSVPVLTPPDLALDIADFSSLYSLIQGGSLALDVKMHNLGETDATAFAAGVYRTGVPWPPTSADVMASISGLNLAQRSAITVTVIIPPGTGLDAVGQHTLTVWIDSTRAIAELNENNNAVNITVNVTRPEGFLTIFQPEEGKQFKPLDRIIVLGDASSTSTGLGLPGIDIEVSLRDSAGNVLVSAAAVTDQYGGFTVGLTVPDKLPDGNYRIWVVETGAQQTVSSYAISIDVKTPKGFFDWEFLGMKLWIFLLIIIIILVVVIAVVAYTRVVGLGKMVECGECGAFIPEDSIKCPKCGVEFEKDMAKCSNCQAWIPLDVKQCPECNVEFATGEVEMADYEQKMRVQYDEVKKKFREQSQQELGRPLTDAEFEDWWKKQPTFLTFEDWLREEEEMRKMGSKACPTCGTLNSITATVCHKCGTLMKKEEPKKGARPPPKEEMKAAPGPTEVERPGEETPAAEPRPTEPVPKKVVVKKPVMPTVIQKKVVIKKPVEEGKEGTEGEGTSSEEEI